MADKAHRLTDEKLEEMGQLVVMVIFFLILRLVKDANYCTELFLLKQFLTK